MASLLSSEPRIVGNTELVVTGRYYGVRITAPLSVQCGAFLIALGRLGINDKTGLEHWSVAESRAPYPGWSVVFAFTVDNSEQCGAVKQRFLNAAQAAGIGEPAWVWIGDPQEQTGLLGELSESLTASQDGISNSASAAQDVAGATAIAIGETGEAIHSFLFWSLLIGGAVVVYLYWKGLF